MVEPKRSVQGARTTTTPCCSRSSACLFRVRAILPFQIGFDLVEREPRRSELSPRVERRLIEIVRRCRIAARAHRVHREPANRWPELDHAHVRATRDAVTPLLTPHRPRDVAEHHAVLLTGAAHGDARALVGQLLIDPLVDSLQAIHFTPGHPPSPPLTLQLRDSAIQRRQWLSPIVSPAVK